TGIVIDKDRKPIQSRVLAILVRPKLQSDTPKNAVVNVAETNETGYFKFVNLPPGDYVLLSIPKDNQFAPGYYKMNDFATLSWKDASIITVDEVMIQMIFEIKHRERLQLKGLVRFDGQIFDHTNLIKQENNPQCVERAVDQALVVAKSIEGNVIQYFVTGSDGKFVLEELPPTSFKIFISKVGYKEVEATYVGDYETNFAFNNNFYLDKEVNEVQEDRNHTIHLNEQQLIISFDDAFELKNIQIFDVFGNSLPVLISSYGKSVSIDVSYYSVGVYFARIITNKDKILTKFIIVR
ncbi:MAG: T9SS type A sorting domain-containing protein, partial [Candidatus Kapaibacteriota bacterium]